MSELALSWRTGLEHMVAGCGDVSFMDDLVVGQWHACERRTGRVLWQRPPHMGGHYVTHVGRTDGVLIGTVQHGLVFSASGGAFAFDAETGVLLWRRFARNPFAEPAGAVSWPTSGATSSPLRKERCAWPTDRSGPPGMAPKSAAKPRVRRSS